MTIQDEFISTVSHELRTPLTSIRGFSQTLLSSWEKLDDNTKKKFIKIIEEQSGRLINLVENILTVSKMSTDKPIMRAVNVNITAEKVIQMFSLKYKNHIIKEVFDPKLPNIMVDEDKLQQILTNLIDNAGKYSPENTTITISTSSFEEKVIIKIKDEGVGIKEDDLCKIYEKFVRLENHLTSKTQGNGLGLFITKNLVESMNGEISADSKPGAGTIFTVKFPVYNQEEALQCSLQS